MRLILGVGQTALTEKEVARAFRARSKLVHPDKLPRCGGLVDAEEMTEAFQRLQAAAAWLRRAARH